MNVRAASLNLSLNPGSTPPRRTPGSLQLTPSPGDVLRGAGTRSGMTERERDRRHQEIMSQTNLLQINGERIPATVDDLEHLGDLGHGTCGTVVKMRHNRTSTVIAVKQMRRTGNPEEEKRILMDLDVVLKSHDCKEIVLCLGCFITASEVWICMELMATCFDKLLKQLKRPIPEPICGKVAVATLKALNYLKEKHDVIHRDVKPSNILLDANGRVKLCDFGISGRLVDSQAKTRNAGCAAYMAPERIEPPQYKTDYHYDIRSDVWSLGITLVEMATGQFPYKDCTTDFEVSAKVVQDDPPLLPMNSGFSVEFCAIVRDCLMKNYKDRPKYKKLLQHPFVLKYEQEPVDVGAWYKSSQRQLNCAGATSTDLASKPKHAGITFDPMTSAGGAFKPQPSPRVARAATAGTRVLNHPVYPSAIGEQQRKRDLIMNEPWGTHEAPPPTVPSSLRRPSFDLQDRRSQSGQRQVNDAMSSLRISSSTNMAPPSTAYLRLGGDPTTAPRPHYEPWALNYPTTTSAYSRTARSSGNGGSGSGGGGSSAFSSPSHRAHYSSYSGPPSLQQPAAQDNDVDYYKSRYGYFRSGGNDYTYAKPGSVSGPPSYGVSTYESRSGLDAKGATSLTSTPHHKPSSYYLPTTSGSSRHRSVSINDRDYQYSPPHHHSYQKTYVASGTGRESRADAYRREATPPSPSKRSPSTDKPTGAYFSPSSRKTSFTTFSWMSPMSSFRRRTASTDRGAASASVPSPPSTTASTSTSGNLSFDRRFQPRYRSLNEKDGYFSQLNFKR